ncbi:uncharacterized protein EAF01_011146 [Botrytis porri]|uniref:Uncharacterized protein n=1 Tax=Botrytis porri TaxID=87229 RepID=A0A4Z1KQ83_9HELO|nr:uncharacterized protein EAF01_011146 [Botrytis porri]KAF7887992.1 hypothetical protein EAF01_011146 [Botrytis porri]TGO83609.1 hypothetical protein BPOR_0620g00070 [Botrytis porri]
MKRQVRWYSTEGYPFIIFADEDESPFAFRQDGIIEEIAEEILHERKAAILGTLVENRDIDLYIIAKVMMVERPHIKNATAMEKALYFMKFVQDVGAVKFRGKPWSQQIQDAYSTRSSSSGESSTSNGTHKTLEKKPKDVKKAGKGITVIPKPVEGANSSISSDGRQKGQKDKEADKRKRRDAYEREKQRKADEDKKRREQDDAAEMERRKADLEQFNADRTKHMAQAKKSATHHLRDESPMRKKTNDDRKRH